MDEFLLEIFIFGERTDGRASIRWSERGVCWDHKRGGIKWGICEGNSNDIGTCVFHSSGLAHSLLQKEPKQYSVCIRGLEFAWHQELGLRDWSGPRVWDREGRNLQARRF